MRARDLAEPYPFVTTDDEVMDAARMLAEQSLPALQHDGEHAGRLAGLTVGEWAPRRLYAPPVVGPDARPMEVAALMARTHSPLVAVIERDSSGVTLLGTITAARLMQHFLQAVA
jgi:CBS domain-containing protein